MPENIPITSVNSELISAGLNPNNPSMTTVDFATSMTKARQEQQMQEQAIARAKELTTQSQIQTKHEVAANEAGLNPLLVDTMTPEEARAYLKIVLDAKGLEIDEASVEEWVKTLPQRVNRSTVENFATRFARSSTRDTDPVKFETKDKIMLPKGETAENLGLIADEKDPRFGHVPEDGMYQVVYDNQGTIKKFIPGGKEALAKDGGLTPGEKAVDVNFGKDYAEWVASGGYTKIEENLNKLQVVVDKLDKSDNLTGPAISLLPESVRQRMYPESQDTQDVISEVVQQSLKMILGAQFTQQEAFAILKRSYNIALEEKINAKRVKRVLSQLAQGAKIKAAAVKEFEEKGSLKDWTGYEKISAIFADKGEDKDETEAPSRRKTDKTEDKSKVVVKKQYSKSADKTKIIYSDGSEEIVDGRK